MKKKRKTQKNFNPDTIAMTPSGVLYSIKPAAGSSGDRFKKKHIVINKIPESIKAQNQLAEDAIEFALQETCISLADFPISRQMSPYRFFKVAETNPYFAECIEIANGCIASRLRRVAHEANPENYAWKQLPMHDGQFKDLLKEMRSSDKQQSSDEEVKHLRNIVAQYITGPLENKDA